MLGAIAGTVWSRLRRYDGAARAQGLHGFNAALVGAATALLLEPGWLAWLAAALACAVATELAEAARRRLPFAVYTAPFVAATWLLLFVADVLGIPAATLEPIGFDSLAKGVAAGVGQVFFVDSELSGLLLVLGIAAANWSAAMWAVAGSALGAIGASGAGLAADEIAAGLFGYNSALVAIALAARGMPAWVVAAASLATVAVVLALQGDRHSSPHRAIRVDHLGSDRCMAVGPRDFSRDPGRNQTSRSNVMSQSYPAGVEIRGLLTPEYAEVLTHDALAFVAGLAREFEARRRELLQRRAARQAEFDAGKLPDFLLETAHVREGSWTIAPQPKDLQDRRVEITGPTDRKMIINALNSGANVFMADFEDANCPTWANMIEGQINLRDAVARRISFTNPDGKRYALNEKTATLMVRPRNWHLMERHVLVDGQPVSGALFDFGLYFFHNAAALIERGTGPYFYLPKMESHLEARLWNDVFNLAAGRARAGAGHDQGCGAHRDHRRRLRDGRDPLRAAQPFGGAQRGALGLHLLLHQDISE